MFLRCIDRENGSLLRLPFNGCEREQPFKTMQVFDLLQSVFLEVIASHMDDLKNRYNVKTR